MGQLKAQNIPEKKKLSIIIPCYNEESSILALLKKITSLPYDRSYEIIIVNDGSTDNSESIIFQFMESNKQLPLFYFKQNNQGKGGAVMTGAKNGSGDFFLIQDADLEYSPHDYPILFNAIDSGAQVVYGSRNQKTIFRQHSSCLFLFGGLAITKLTNLLFGSHLTDEATGYKLFTREVFMSFNLKHKDFAWEPEITAKILKKNIKIVEVPISYFPRSKKEGKKITWQDGIKAAWVLLSEYFNK